MNDVSNDELFCSCKSDSWCDTSAHSSFSKNALINMNQLQDEFQKLLMKQDMQRSAHSRSSSKSFVYPDFMHCLQMKTARTSLPPDTSWRKTSFTCTNHSGSIVRKMRKVAYLHLHRYETKCHLHSLMLKLGCDLTQGLRSDRLSLKRCFRIL